MTTTAERIAAECDALKRLLLDKNAAYSDSATEPVRLFSEADAVERILSRLDDKLSRLARGQDAGEDTEGDFIGYLILLRVIRRGALAEVLKRVVNRVEGAGAVRREDGGPSNVQSAGLGEDEDRVSVSVKKALRDWTPVVNVKQGDGNGEPDRVRPSLVEAVRASSLRLTDIDGLDAALRNGSGWRPDDGTAREVSRILRAAIGAVSAAPGVTVKARDLSTPLRDPRPIGLSEYARRLYEQKDTPEALAERTITATDENAVRVEYPDGCGGLLFTCANAGNQAVDALRRVFAAWVRVLQPKSLVIHWGRDEKQEPAPAARADSPESIADRAVTLGPGPAIYFGRQETATVLLRRFESVGQGRDEVVVDLMRRVLAQYIREAREQGLAKARETFTLAQQAENDLRADRDKYRERAEQLEVQLAGCGVAAMGGTNPEQRAKQGDYGWSASYGDVLALRQKYEALLAGKPEPRDEAPTPAEVAAGQVWWWFDDDGGEKTVVRVDNVSGELRAALTGRGVVMLSLLKGKWEPIVRGRAARAVDNSCEAQPAPAASTLNAVGYELITEYRAFLRRGGQAPDDVTRWVDALADVLDGKELNARDLERVRLLPVASTHRPAPPPPEHDDRARRIEAERLAHEIRGKLAQIVGAVPLVRVKDETELALVQRFVAEAHGWKEAAAARHEVPGWLADLFAALRQNAVDASSVTQRNVPSVEALGVLVEQLDHKLRTDVFAPERAAAVEGSQ